MQATHKVPTHMSLPDKVVFGLTARQLLLLLIGCSLGYNLWLHLGALEALALIGQVLRIGIALIPTAIAAILALISVADRPLEVWHSLRMSELPQHIGERDYAPYPAEAVWSYA